MKTFIGDLADHLLKDFSDLRNHTIVFPNRRAGLFLQQELGKNIKKPIWLPTIISFEDFVLSKSVLEKIDTLEAVFLLHQVYDSHQINAERLEKFFFWGEMIVKDFEEIDHYEVNAQHLFTSIKSQKELDQEFYFLSEEEKSIIESFWSTFLPDSTKNQDAFLETWKILRVIYQDYKKLLISKGKGYNGMIYLAFLDALTAGAYQDGHQIIFVGFNALTHVEEKIIKYYVKNRCAEVCWDTDSYYVNDVNQEAGYFHRLYRGDSVLGATFEKELPSNFALPKSFQTVGVSLEVGQAKALGADLVQLMNKADFISEKTVIVLPHEYMLFPVLHSLPLSLEHVNITMGFPLKDTPVYSLLISMLMLQNSNKPTLKNKASFYYKPVIEILEHPLIVNLNIEGHQDIVKKIKKYNLVYIDLEEIPVNSDLLTLIFSIPQTPIDYLIAVLKSLHDTLKKGDRNLELEFIGKYYEHVHQLKIMIAEQGEGITYEFLIKLFQKISKSLKVPFSGEPLKGIQIMGILETRNLDFEHVFVLSMNENAWPAAPNKGSFIPYNIRRAFNLPVHEHQDSIYAYLFYRLLQRSSKVIFYYNTVSEFNINGELSRLVKQLALESGHVIKQQIMANPISLGAKKPISVIKDDLVMRKMDRFTSDFSSKYMSRLTPSALDTYLYCKLRFYFKYVEQLYEEDQIQEELDAMIFGNILHDAMELLYGQFITRKKTGIINETDFFWIREGVNGAINEAFNKHHQTKNNKKKIVLEGRSIIAADIIKKIINKILDYDQEYAPFKIVGLESSTKEGYSLDFPIEVKGKKHLIALKGKIDRIDLKGGVLRVLDYKTGKDEKTFVNIPSLIDAENPKRNKAAFQIFFYSYMVMNGYREPYDSIQPGLFNSKNLFDQNFDWKLTEKQGRQAEVPVFSFQRYLPEFEAILNELLVEIWNTEIPFDQISDVKKCGYCPYNGICTRN